MRYVLYNGEKDANDLAKRIFAIRGRNAAAKTSDAADALLKANPQLSDSSKLAVGTVITVPDSLPPLASPDAPVASTAMRSFAVDAAQTAVDAMQQRLAEIESTATNRLASAMKLIQTSSTKTAMKNIASLHPELAAQLPDLAAIAKSAAQVVKSVQAAQKLRTTSLASVTAALGKASQ